MLDPASDLTAKRAILLSTQHQFAPELRPLRETAIDNYVERILYVFDEDQGLKLDDVVHHGIYSLGAIPLAVGVDNYRSALHRLVDEGHVERLEAGRYRLTGFGRASMEGASAEAKSRLDRCVNSLFRDFPRDASVYSKPFLECVSRIFADIGGSYVDVLRQTRSPDAVDVVSPRLLDIATRETKREHDYLTDDFDGAVRQFIAASDPDSQAIKWNLTQNHYLLKSLGIDESGQLLSQELFGGSVLYLDTNVLIAAVEPLARHHASFVSLSRICDRMTIRLVVAENSLEELKGLTGYKMQTILKVRDTVPSQSMESVDDVFLERYIQALEEDPSSEMSDAMAHFMQPESVLRNEFGVEIVSDPWFDTAAHDDRTSIIVKRLIYASKRRRGRQKHENSARHDALVLQRVAEERVPGISDVWLLTLDTTLVGAESLLEPAQTGTFVITLDALLQWISPMAHADESATFAQAFSDAVSRQLLPQDNFFSLEDFLLFSDLGMDTSELPPKDVEDCVRFLKQTAKGLNPSRAEDREKLAHHVSKFFKSPDREYKKALSESEAEKARLAEDHAREKSELISYYDQKIKDADAEKRAVHEKHAKESATRRLFLAITIWVLAVIAPLTIVVMIWGIGPNPLAKLISAWPLYVGLGPSSLIIFALLLLGREGLERLGLQVPSWIKS